jgi:hypothetical protein
MKHLTYTARDLERLAALQHLGWKGSWSCNSHQVWATVGAGRSRPADRHDASTACRLLQDAHATVLEFCGTGKRFRLQLPSTGGTGLLVVADGERTIALLVPLKAAA